MKHIALKFGSTTRQQKENVLKILITGATGFVGKHLRDVLTEHELIGIARRSVDLDGFQQVYATDVCDSEKMHQIIQETQPDWIIHLAAQAHVGTSFKNPWETLKINIKGTLNVLEAIKDTRIRLLLVSSAEVYGHPQYLPIDETHPLSPVSPYSVSKCTQETLAWQYTRNHGTNIIIARPFNHIGPGQNTRFALPNFALQIAEMEAGQRPCRLEVGNLAAERDFSDVRDIATAYQLLIEKGQANEVYNIGTGQAYSIATMVDILISKAKVNVQVAVDPDRLRDIDVPKVVANADKLRAATDWQPYHSLENTIEDILDAARLVVSR